MPDRGLAYGCGIFQIPDYFFETLRVVVVRRFDRSKDGDSKRTSVFIYGKLLPNLDFLRGFM